MGWAHFWALQRELESPVSDVPDAGGIDPVMAQEARISALTGRPPLRLVSST